MATLLKNKNYFTENAIDLDFLREHETAQADGRLHAPVLHSTILEKWRNKASSLGITLTGEQGALSRDGKRFMYVADVSRNNDDDFNLSIAFRNFNDKSLAFHGACGAHVLCCSNGMLTSIIVPSRQRHTVGNLTRLDDKIDIIFDRFRADSQSTVDRISMYKNTEYTDRLLGDFILAVGRSGIIGNTHVLDILREVDNPTLNDKNDHSAWRIINAATYVTTHKIKNPIASSNASKFMHDTLCGLIDPTFRPLGDVQINPVEEGEVINVEATAV